VSTRAPLLSDHGEFELIDRLNARFAQLSPQAGTRLGMGDDAALVQSGDTLWAITTDSLIEGTHFTQAIWPATSVGHRALAVNLSDLAAMGATPQNVLLSLALRPELELSWFDDFLEGFARSCERYKVQVIGGNLSRSQQTMISVTAMGSVKQAHAKLRSGAKAGDLICVTGKLGDAGAGLEILLRSKKITANLERLVTRHLYPEPRVELGLFLAKSEFVHAMMDLSDGLAGDLPHLARASRLDAHIDLDKLPVSHEFVEYEKSQARSPQHSALRNGEDYELLFSISREDFASLANQSMAQEHAALTAIGHFETSTGSSPQVFYWERGVRLELEPSPKFLHFKSP
jgi:thiamine-monophosphate kinase